MAAAEPVQWTFRATSQDSGAACRAAETWSVGAGFEAGTVSALVLIIEELFTNTIKHAYDSSGGPVRIGLAPQGAFIELTYADQGKPFDPSAEFLQWQRNLEEGKAGGLGLRLIQSFGSSFRYRRDNDWNRTTLVVGESPETE